MSRYLRLVACACVAVWFGVAVADARQNPLGLAQFIGQPVTAIRFEVEEKPVTSEALVANVAVAVGKPLSAEDVRSSIAQLSQVYDGVAVIGEAAAGGVAVVFRLMPRHPISRVAFAFTSATEISVPELEAGFKRQFGGLPTTNRVPAAEETVRRLLADMGYIDARVVSRTVVTHDPDRATLVFDIAPGVEARIGQVEVRLQGSAPVTQETVLARAGIAPGTPFKRRALQTAMVRFQDELRAQGYYEAIAASSDDRSAGADRVNVILAVDTGRKVELVFAGDKLPGSVGKMDDLVPVRRVGSADLSLLEDAQRDIRTRLQNAGYKDSTVTLSEREGEGGARIVTYRVTLGPRYRIDRVEIPSGLVLPRKEIEERLDLPTGSPFSEARVNAGLTRVILAYQQLGYAAASATPAYQDVPETPADPANARVAILLDIKEGARYQVSAIRFDRGARAAQVPDADLLAAIRLHVGLPYTVASLRQDQAALEDLYNNRGYRSVQVNLPPPVFTPAGELMQTEVVFHIDEGPQVIVGALTVVGNQQIDQRTIRDVVTLREGEPFGEAQRLDSVRRLAQMGVFGSVRIEEEARLTGQREASIVISVTELPRTTVGVGGGLEVGRRPSTEGGQVADTFDLAPRGFFEIGRGSLGGRDRRVNLFTRVAIKRPNISDDPLAHDTRYAFSEYRVTGTYSERRAFNSDTDLLFGVTAEQGVRTNFNFQRQSVNAEGLHHLSPSLGITGRYILDSTFLYDEKIPPEDQFEVDRLFPQVRLSILGGGLAWDRRNSPLTPTAGTLLSADVEVAARGLGSEVGYLKTFFQASGFRSLTASKRHVLAMRSQVGMARRSEQFAVLDETFGDLPASQRFFAGGGTTVRGFQLDRLGVPAILTPDGLSNGGNALVIFNVEVRTIVKQLFGRNLATVSFVDVGNVFRRVEDVRLGDLRSAVGAGIRYDSPIGPLRLDIGFKTTRLVFRNGRERGWEYHLSIGEAF